MGSTFKINDFNSMFSYITWGSASLIIALSLLVPDGYSIGAILVLLLSFCLPFVKSKYKLSITDKCLILSFLTYGLGMFFLVYLDGFNTRWLDKPARFILVLFPLILLLKTVLNKNALAISCMIGAFGPFGVAIIERFYFGYPRAEGDENPIMFGGISMLIGLICLNYTLYFYKTRKKAWCFFSAMAFFCGFFASLLSGSKGSWIILPVALIFLFWNYRELISKKLYLNILLAVTLIIGAISLTPSLGVSARIGTLISDVALYLEGNDKETSVSHRAELWKASIFMFQDSPVFGIGRSHQIDFKQNLVDQNLIHKSVLLFTHAHNEFLNELGLHGFFGLISLLIVYLGPLLLFGSKIKNSANNPNIKIYAISGALVPLCYMGFALTQAMFVHNSGVMVYAFLIIIFWAATSWAEREEMVSGNIEKAAD